MNNDKVPMEYTVAWVPQLSGGAEMTIECLCQESAVEIVRVLISERVKTPLLISITPHPHMP